MVRNWRPGLGLRVRHRIENKRAVNSEMEIVMIVDYCRMQCKTKSMIQTVLSTCVLKLVVLLLRVVSVTSTLVFYASTGTVKGCKVGGSWIESLSVLYPLRKIGVCNVEESKDDSIGGFLCKVHRSAVHVH